MREPRSVHVRVRVIRIGRVHFLSSISARGRGNYHRPYRSTASPLPVIRETDIFRFHMKPLVNVEPADTRPRVRSRC